MARIKRDSTLETRSNRNKLAVRAEPYWCVIARPGRALGYRRGQKGGTWIARLYDPEATPKKRYEALGGADDHMEANGQDILTFAQAQGKARDWFERCSREAREAELGESLPEGPLTVNRVLDLYFKDGERRGMKGLDREHQRADAWIRPELGELEVTKLSRTRLETWHQAVAESPKRVRTRNPALPIPTPRVFKVPREPKAVPAAPKPTATEDERRARKASANRALATLKAALNHALDRRLVAHDEAWRGVKPYRGVEESRQEYLTPQEQQRLLNAISAQDFKRLVSGALATGCRYGELCRMKVRDFDPTNHGSILIRLSKSGKSRRVILTKEGRALFMSLTAGRHGDEHIFLRDSVERRTRHTTEPKIWDKNDQQRLMKDACKAAGLPEMGFHQLRHSYASALVAAGMPLALVAKLTGHADTRMLERHYAHLAPSDLSRALEKLAPNLDFDVPQVEELTITRSS